MKKEPKCKRCNYCETPNCNLPCHQEEIGNSEWDKLAKLLPKKVKRFRIYEIIERLEAKAKKEVCEKIISLDKTPEYGYSHEKNYLNAHEEKPPVGEKWQTPRRLCIEILRQLK